MEGYVLHTYGAEKYVRHAVASVRTIRRHDRKRPVALYADEEQIDLLKSKGLDRYFDVLEVLPSANRSIVGFKHHLHEFKPFERSLFVDADMVWCRNPDPLWQQLRSYSFTATGQERADFFFGGPKGIGVVVDILLDRRRATMRKFGITYLPRVQAGMIYAADDETTRAVCTRATEYLSRRPETHFRSRLNEGRSEESCEWSLAMAMSSLDLPVYHWFQGQNSPQLDFVDDFVEHDAEFNAVSCRYYTDSFVHGLRGIPSPTLRSVLLRLFSALPGKGDYIWVTPFALHFGWLHHKKPFYDLADLLWERVADPSGDGANGLEREAAVAVAD